MLTATDPNAQDIPGYLPAFVVLFAIVGILVVLKKYRQLMRIKRGN